MPLGTVLKFLRSLPISQNRICWKQKGSFSPDFASPYRLVKIGFVGNSTLGGAVRARRQVRPYRLVKIGFVGNLYNTCRGVFLGKKNLPISQNRICWKPDECPASEFQIPAPYRLVKIGFVGNNWSASSTLPVNQAYRLVKIGFVGNNKLDHQGGDDRHDAYRLVKIGFVGNGKSVDEEYCISSLTD